MGRAVSIFRISSAKAIVAARIIAELRSSAALRDAGLFVEPCYSDMRRADYPPVGEQLDCLWHAMDDGILPKVEPFFSKILAVKQAHPKTSN